MHAIKEVSEPNDHHERVLGDEFCHLLKVSFSATD